MKYQFIVKIQNINITSCLNKGKIISKNMRISNGNEFFKQNILNETFYKGFGSVEALSFEDGVYIYEKGDYNQLQKDIGYQTTEIDLINFLLRKVQIFTSSLWFVKDNSVTFDAGFLQIYDTHPQDGTLTSNFFSYLPSTSDGEIRTVDYNEAEIQRAIDYYKLSEIDYQNYESDVAPYLENPLYKGSKRVDRALYFLGISRNTTALPIKAINFSSLLECLFTNDSSEITHKVSERCALFIGEEYEERKRTFKLVKSLYKIRSKAIHGQSVGVNPDEMKKMLIKVDKLVRNILLKIIEDEDTANVFKLQNEAFDDWFMDLVLK